MNNELIEKFVKSIVSVGLDRKRVSFMTEDYRVRSEVQDSSKKGKTVNKSNKDLESMHVKKGEEKW